MFRNLTFLGISMREQSHRRAFVIMTYLTMCTAIVLAGIWRASILEQFVGVIWLLVPLLVFGTVVTPYLGMVPLSGPRPPQVVDRGLGLAASVPPEIDPPDERDISVRNSAYFVAYWALTIYCVAMMALVGAVMDRPVAWKKPVMLVAFDMLLVFMVSLPQAVVLWTEHDVPIDI